MAKKSFIEKSINIIKNNLDNTEFSVENWASKLEAIIYSVLK